MAWIITAVNGLGRNQFVDKVRECCHRLKLTNSNKAPKISLGIIDQLIFSLTLQLEGNQGDRKVDKHLITAGYSCSTTQAEK